MVVAVAFALTLISLSAGSLSEPSSNFSVSQQRWRDQSELLEGQQKQVREVSQTSDSLDLIAVERRKAIRHEHKRWPKAIVPFFISSSIDSLSTSARRMIREAMTHWEKETCIRFVPANPMIDKDAVVFVNGSWCTSYVGRIDGLQNLTLAPGCLTVRTIIHEIGHAIGWHHEHSRPDRDNHLKINWDNINKNNHHSYQKYTHNIVDTFGLPYDYESIMHYHGGSDTIKALQPGKQQVMGASEKLSFYDVKLANLMYKCAEKNRCNVSFMNCTGEGYVGPKCTCVCRDGSTKCAAKTYPNKPIPDFYRNVQKCLSLRCKSGCTAYSSQLISCLRTVRHGQ